MIKIHLHGYLKHMAKSEITFDRKNTTVKEIIEYLKSNYPKLAEILLNYDFTCIVNKKALIFPKDLNQQVYDEITIAPIIEGG
jgi:hypothetical protein